MGRAPCCDKASTKRGPWSPDEDAKLKVYIHANGTGGNWIALPKKANLKRCGKSCRLRWINYLRPDIIHGNFTPEEEKTIIDLHEKVGSRWSLIAAKLPRRTDNDIKNFWNTRLKKRVAERRANQQQQQRGYPMRNAAVPRTYPMRSSTGLMFPVTGENHTSPVCDEQQQHSYPMSSAMGTMFPVIAEKLTNSVCHQQQQQRSYPVQSAAGLFQVPVIGQPQHNGLLRQTQMSQMSIDETWDQLQYLDPESRAAHARLSFQPQRVDVQRAQEQRLLLQKVQQHQQQQQHQPVQGLHLAQRFPQQQQQLPPGKTEPSSHWLEQRLPVKNELVSNQPMQSSMRIMEIESELSGLLQPVVSSPQSSTTGSSITSSGGFENRLSVGGSGSPLTSSGRYESGLSAGGLGLMPDDQAANFLQMAKEGGMVEKQDSAGSSMNSCEVFDNGGYASGLGVVPDQASNYYHMVTTIQKQDSEAASSSNSSGGCDSGRYVEGLETVPDQASNLYDVVKEEVFTDDFLPELISPTTQRSLALGGRDWPTTSEDVLPTYQVQRASSTIETTFDESLETAFAEAVFMNA